MNRRNAALDALAVLDAACRNDFATFVGKSFGTLVPGSEFHRNWHIDAMACYAEDVRLGKLHRLIVNVPPRSLKSIVFSAALPAFLLGHDPTERVIVVSYSAELATKLANDFRAILKSPWYRRIFSGTRISATKNTEAEVMTTRGGYRLATSVDGTLTGRGGDIIIIDDPLKPIDALSDSRRERVNQWFANTMLTRLDDKQNGVIILVMQRLHVDDLSGVLLRDSREWTHLCLPAIAEADEQIRIGDDVFHYRRAGDLLHAAREPISVLESIRAQLGSDLFAAQYQQSPMPPGGAMIKRIWVGRYDPQQLPRNGRILQSWDTANKNGGQNDWSVCATLLIHENRYYLIDMLRGRFDYPTLKARVLEHARLHRPSKILIEDAGVGTALIAELRRSAFSVIPVKPEHDKLTRMSIQSGKFESGRVLFPRWAPWLADLEAELFAFPNSRHDDQVDSISQALGNAYSYYDPGIIAKGLERLMEGFWY